MQPCGDMFLSALSFQIRRVKSGWTSRREAGTRWQWCWARREVGVAKHWSKEELQEKRGKVGLKGGTELSSV